jgi:predicted secreted hydrolase
MGTQGAFSVNQASVSNRHRTSLPRQRLTVITLAWVAVWSVLTVVAGHASEAAGSATPEPSDAPVPIQFPRDDGAHEAPIEWWYYTGHLTTSSGGDYGFEFVVFKGELGGVRGLAAHFAVTDHPGSSFHYDQRIALDRGPVLQTATGFNLSVGDWRMSGASGNDQLVAEMPGYAIALDLLAEKPAVLHDGDGFIDYGGGQGSYYYSRTRLDVSGSITLDDQSESVRGQAWMDHQWGNFSTFRDGGWDWFSVQLDDHTELMLYIVHNRSGAARVADGSFVAADGSVSVLGERDFNVTASGTWTSPATGVTYPSGWRVEVPDLDLSLTLTPTMPDQELDARATTGVIYWEGEVVVDGATEAGPVTGVGYVELTGYTTSTELASPVPK